MKQYEEELFQLKEAARHARKGTLEGFGPERWEPSVSPPRTPPIGPNVKRKAKRRGKKKEGRKAYGDDLKIHENPMIYDERFFYQL